MFQLAYTTLFGALAGFLFLRTGHIVGVCLVHAFCNFMGFPDTSFASSGDPMNRYATVLWLTYIIGIGIFFTKLDSWTDPHYFNAPHWSV